MLFLLNIILKTVDWDLWLNIKFKTIIDTEIRNTYVSKKDMNDLLFLNFISIYSLPIHCSIQNIRQIINGQIHIKIIFL